MKIIPMIQIADLTGVFGITFLIVCVNVVVFLLIRDIVEKTKLLRLQEIAVVACLLIVAIIYGFVRIGQIERRIEDTPKFNFALIQGNIEQGVKWDASYRAATLGIYTRLTLMTLSSKPELIVWPETSAPFNFRTYFEGRHYILSLAEQTGSDIIFGSPTYRLINGQYFYYNSAFLVTPDRQVTGQYDKSHLVPFGEFVPFSKILSFVHKLAEGVGDFSKGDKLEPLPFSKGKAGILICYEGILPKIAREMVNNGAGILANISNDAWFGPTSAPYQLLEMSALRAVENRTYLLRSANTGISAYVDPLGRIHSPTGIFCEATGSGTAAMGPFGGLYRKAGDTFVYFCFFCLVAFLLLPVIEGRFAK